MKKILACTLTILALVVISSCGGGEKKSDKKANTAKGDVKYGDVMRYNETEYFRSLFPLNITEVVGHRIVNNVYEGLVMLNQADLTVEPCLATNWDVNEDATVFTFHLRPGVYFHDDECFANGKGREVKAEDFVYSMNLLCSEKTANEGFWLFQGLVKGADECHDGKTKTVEGIKALNDSTLELTLVKPFSAFLYRLAMPFCAVFPKEAFDKYGLEMREKCVGTGPFRVKKLLNNETVILARNENYWGVDQYGNKLPYLDGVKISFIKDEKIELLSLRKGELDYKYRLPLDAVKEVLDANGNLTADYKQFQLQKTPELSAQFYGFFLPNPIFANKDVRQAFNYAVDRKKLVDYTLQGEGTAGMYGVVPVGIKGYDNTMIKGYDFNPEKARELMAKAGYKDGKGFPKITLQINSGGGRNEKIAESVQKMLTETLGIEIEIKQLVWAQHTENYEKGKAEFFRYAWVADYPDPENFLNLFYGKHVPAKLEDKAYLNSVRYKNPKFDALFEKALSIPNEAERYKLYEQCDQMLADDAPVIILYNSVNRRLLQPYVRNYPANGMEYRAYREVWFDK
jgi:oligopeptide transport system substrate-binding protein